MNAIERERAALRQLANGVAATPTGDVGLQIRRAARVILVLLWVLGAVAAVVSGVLLLHHARSHTEATAISLEQFARRTITLAAFAVDEYEEFLDVSGGVAGAAGNPANAAKLAELARWLPEGSTLGVVDPDGTWVASSVSIIPPPPRVTDRRWYQAHGQDGLATFIGPAILSRVSNRHVFTYSAAYRSPGGKLLGIIMLGIPSNSITGLAPDQHHTNMALVQHDGFVVAAQPFRPEMIGKEFPLPGPVPEAEDTRYAHAFGSWSVATTRNVRDLGLYSVVAVPLTDVLQPLIWSVGIALPLLLLLTQLLTGLSGQLQEKSRQVEQALADNKVLFQEVHHRVKNNLQVVSSLLRLQTERLPPELRPLLDQTGARVRAIALVHEQIYRTSSPSDVQLDRFLAQLVQQLSASMIGGTGRITTDLQPMTIGLDRAVPVAILATEAITNAIKHGLEAGDGEITVSLAARDGHNVLTVRDSGRGVAEEGDSTGLGTRIMTALSRQIDGEWTLRSGTAEGTVFTLSWPG